MGPGVWGFQCRMAVTNSHRPCWAPGYTRKFSLRAPWTWTWGLFGVCRQRRKKRCGNSGALLCSLEIATHPGKDHSGVQPWTVASACARFSHEGALVCACWWVAMSKCFVARFSFGACEARVSCQRSASAAVTRQSDGHACKLMSTSMIPCTPDIHHVWLRKPKDLIADCAIRIDYVTYEILSPVGRISGSGQSPSNVRLGFLFDWIVEPRTPTTPDDYAQPNYTPYP